MVAAGGAAALLRRGVAVAMTRPINLLSTGVDRPGTEPPPPWPAGFFERADGRPDDEFYAPPRLVTHLDDAAIAEVGRLYRDLGLDGAVLDLMSSWISHFDPPPAALTVLGMNALELDRNAAATEAGRPRPQRRSTAAVRRRGVRRRHVLRVDRLPGATDRGAHRRGAGAASGGAVRCTFSNRCFPTKAIRGWLYSSEAGRVDIVRRYLDATGAFGEVRDELRNPGRRGDPLYAVWAHRR